jgi:sterol desaturase/sphingolipid hydroxylase (fatty acid hydroxylase superfamily)
MSFYIKTLFYAIPTFMVLIVLEAVVAKAKGININRSSDVISSLSSGITNTIRDAIKFTFAIVTYSWLVDHITVYKIEPYWLAFVVAFFVKDFSGYCVHRLNHRVNVLWNRHLIHHSSEDFNLSCALRQSISNTIKFSAVFMIPAALLGVPASIFAVLGPIHLFMQLWYHTQIIGKLGPLEYVIVTPSHHRVHHAINPDYIDKNYGQILIIWDKIFGTFQAELDHVKPVYGILNQANTWNPILINYKYMWQLIKDAWHAENIFDKIKIWFMPTGWRPGDVSRIYPLKKIEDPNKQIKYNTKNSSGLIYFCWAQLFFTGLFMFHLFTVIHNTEMVYNYLYALFIFVSIFSNTSLLDGSTYSWVAEIFKLVLGLSIIYTQNYSWYNLSGMSIYPVLAFIAGSFLCSLYFQNNNKRRTTDLSIN